MLLVRVECRWLLVVERGCLLACITVCRHSWLAVFGLLPPVGCDGVAVVARLLAVLWLW